MKKIILDVDTGVDDAMAIMVALSSPNVEVIGITCCHGNTPLDNVVTNTLRVLQVCKKTEIPVYPGCRQPLLSSKIHASNYHGKDGLGDVPDPEPPSQDQLQGRKAAAALVKMARTHPGEVTLVATAPLTNLAVAVQLHPDFPKKLKALYIMGGNTECRHSGRHVQRYASPLQPSVTLCVCVCVCLCAARGNTTVCGEFNFVADPEAAHIVLDRYTCPTYIAGWEFTCRNSLPWSFCDEWFCAKTDKAEFMKKISSFSMKKARSKDYREKETTEGSGFNSCDTYAVAAAVDDEFILEKEEVAVTVELEGTHTRGMMVLDYMGLLKKDHKAFIMKKVDLEKLKKMLITALK